MADLNDLDRQVQGILGRLQALESAVRLPAGTSVAGLSTVGLKGGAYSYVDSNDAAEGPYWFDGTTWRPPWNMPWGLLGRASVTADQTGITTAADLTGLSVTWTSYDHREVTLFAKVRFTQNTSPGIVQLLMMNGATQVNRALDNFGSGESHSLMIIHTGVPPAGSQTRKLQATTNAGTLDLKASSTEIAFIMAVDMGPTGAPP